MELSVLKTVNDEVLDALGMLIPQLSPNCRLPAKEDLESIINSKNSEIIIAAEDEKILGSLTLVFVKTPTGKKVWIEDVVVDSTARGKGIGERLVKFAVARASQSGADKIDLTSIPQRVAANKLYQKLGFVKRDTNVYRLIIDG